MVLHAFIVMHSKNILLVLNDSCISPVNEAIKNPACLGKTVYFQKFCTSVAGSVMCVQRERGGGISQRCSLIKISK